MAKKVLIVEDSESVGEALRMLIEFEGYQVIVAVTASSGRIMATAAQPDLIIMDVRLPDFSGIELTRELRSLPELSRTPILCVSSYVEDFETEARTAGCNDVFSKADFIESFRPTLKKYLGEDRLRH